MNFTEISFSRIKAQIEDFLKTEYNKASILFSAASPYGQILSVIENLHQLSLMYLKNTLVQFDLSNASISNDRITRNAAIFAGHNPTRGISASGTIKFTLKSNIDTSDIPGQRIVMLNKTTITNKTNSLNYTINTGVDRMTHLITSKSYSFTVNIIQGKWTTKTYTGTGEPLQTFFVNEVGLKEIENFNVEISVNGELWTLKKHMYDMIPDEKAVIVKTGFDGGIDVIFGNSGFGMIPPIGSVIEISYLVTEGSLGNIFRRTQNDWKFVDDIFDGNGGTIDVGKIFDIDIFTDISFGADGETPDFTRTLLPIVSNNFVLALPQQYAYEIKKLGVFSHVNAYEKSGTIYISLTPNINLFKNQNDNYFNIDLAAFQLDDWEKTKIYEYLKTSGTIQLTQRFKISNPTLSFYILNVFVIPYSDVTDESLNAQILDTVSNYFLNLTRMDRIPKLDIIRALSALNDIHSVDIQFVCKKNEDYHRNYLNQLQNQSNSTNAANILPSATYNPNESLGLDPLLGDILFTADEIPVVRGGWSNRYDINNDQSAGIHYSDNIDSNGPKAVNIFKNGTVDAKNRPI